MNITYRPIADDWQGKRRRSFETSGTPFKAKWTDTLTKLDRELRMLGARRVVVQIDLPESSFRIDGNPRSDARDPDFAGVIVSFDTKKHGPLRYQCDAFDGYRGQAGWQANVRAIALGLEALRKVERYGIAARGEQYTGWRAIGSAMPMPEATAMTEDEAIAFLHAHAPGVEWDYDVPDQVHAAYRVAAKALHPDAATGDTEQFKRLGAARDLLVNRR